MTERLAHRMMQAAVLLLLATTARASAQVCPQFKNPTSFVTNDSLYYWSARVGERIMPAEMDDTTTGSYIMSTCTAAPTIPGENITSAFYNSGTDGSLSHCNEVFFDANARRFQIITEADSGMDMFTVRNDGTGMPRIPPGYTSCIRLGDMRSTGICSDDHNYHTGESNSNESSEALFYTMYVTTANALLIINYAVVARRFSHTAYDAGEFLIRVVGQVDDSTWADEPLSDSLWYKVSAPNFDNNGLPAGWRVGANHGAWPCTYAYKPWSTVGINLDKYLYHNVRIEMYTSDCIYNADPIYAYICGDYSPLTVITSGCPQPESDAIDTLIAPAGMASYRWYVATKGADPNTWNSSHMDSVMFRPVTNAGPNHKYAPKVGDFRLTQGPNAGDTVGEQTFMCIMTSALDPLKPIQSKMYANVVFQRPLMYYSTEGGCDTTVYFHNHSKSLTGDMLYEGGTYWVIFSDSTFSSVLDTLYSNDTSYHFAKPGYYGVKLYCTTSFHPCPAEKKFVCQAKGGDDLAFNMWQHKLCEDEMIEVACTEGCGNEKRWIVDGTEMGGDDSLMFRLPVGAHQVELESVNSLGCSTRVQDTVLVMGEPRVSISPEETEICIGDSLTLDVGGNLQYRWESSPHDNSLPSGFVGSVVTVKPQQTTTYTLTPATYNPCFRGNANVTVTVLDYPRLKVETNRTELSLDDNVLALTDLSANHTNTTWIFDDGSEAYGSHHLHWFDNLLDMDSACVWMISCNKTNCCRDTSFCLPVSTFSIWFPNAFTPNLEENNRFTAVSSIEPTDYEIAIYNRQGLLVYESHNIAEGWDGKDRHGNPCPQGAYAYHYRYAKDNSGSYYEGRGTVTLIR